MGSPVPIQSSRIISLRSALRGCNKSLSIELFQCQRGEFCSEMEYCGIRCTSQIIKKLNTLTAILSVVIVLFAVSFLTPSTATAQIPRQISYQGLLITSNGVPISDGQHVLKITIYDAVTGGNSLFSESIPTTTNHGLFDVIIGASSGIPFSLDFSIQYFIGVEVDGGPEMSPRTPFTSVPYSLRAQIAEQAKSVSPDAQGIVTSINEVDGPIRIIGDSTTSVLQNGRVITISANPQGIRAIQNTDGTITITQPKGPTVTLNITDTSLTASKLARNSVTTAKIEDGAVTGEKINQMGAFTGQVLKWNGTKWTPAMDDTTKIRPGTGIVITTDANGNNVIATTLVGLPPGGFGATLRKDTNAWVATMNLYNDGNNIGIGTTAPKSKLDVSGTLTLSNNSDLRFTEPASQGSNFTSFKAAQQANDISYTLPPSLPVNEAILTTDPTGQMNWKNILPPSVTVSFSQITTGVNRGQVLTVGDSSKLKLSGTGLIESNALKGATVDGSSYAGRVRIPKGATGMTVTLPPTVGCTSNSSVTVSQFDSEGFNVLVGTMVTSVATDNFSVQFSASYPTDTGYITYLVVNP